MTKETYLHNFVFEFTCPYCGKTNHEIHQCTLPNKNTLYYTYCKDNSFCGFLHLDGTFFFMLRHDDYKYNYVTHIFETDYIRDYKKVIFTIDLECTEIQYPNIDLHLNRSFLPVSLKKEQCFKKSC